MPSPDRLPPGPLRDLVEALHELYRDAGKPGTRRISEAISKRDSLRDTVSHETVSSLLRGEGLPRWSKLECLVREFVEWSVNRYDEAAEVRRFHALWLAASDGAAPAHPALPDDAVAARSPAGPPPDARQRPHRALGPVDVPGNLPSRNPHFTGREPVLAALAGALTHPSALPVILHGLGGVGKTQLAIEYAYRAHERYDLTWWIPAEQPSVARASLAALGERLDVPLSVDIQQTTRTVINALEARGRWLLIFDNADEPDDIFPLLPAAAGHCIVTSRNRAWAVVGTALVIDVFDRPESIDLLSRRGHEISLEDANRLAEKLGDLPLALEQVAAMQAATGMPAAEYLQVFDRHVTELLAVGRPSQYPTPVATFLRVAFGRLQAESPAAAQLLELFAVLGAEPISAALLRRGRQGGLAPPLGRVLYQPDALDRILRQLERYGVARVDPKDQRIQVHRLLQLVLREGMNEDGLRLSRRNVHCLCAAANPGNPDDPLTWALHAEIGPHIVPSGLVEADQPEERRVALDQIRYLWNTGDYDAARALGEIVVATWQAAESEGLGPDGEQTLDASLHLANALRSLGDNAGARSLALDAYARLRRNPELGEDHGLTILAAIQVGADLRLAGDFRRALAIDTENLERRRRVVSDTSTRKLRSRARMTTNNLAVNLRLLGDFEQALRIDEESVKEWQETVGDEQPQTLFATANVARDLYGLGRYAEALELQARTWPAYRDVLGPRHNLVLLAARTLAIALRKTGQYDDALRQAHDNYHDYHACFGPDHEHTLAATMSYANALAAAGRPQEARALAEEAVDLYRRRFGERHPLTLAAVVNLAIILRALGERRKARRADERTVWDLREVLGADHPFTLAAVNGLANDLALDHQLGAARLHQERVAAASRRIRGAGHPDTLACELNLALDMVATGDETAGRALAVRTIASLSDVLGPNHPEVDAARASRRAECDIEPPPT